MFTLDGITIRVLEERDLEAARKLRNDPSTWMNLTSAGFITAEQQRAWYTRVSTALDRRYYVISSAQHDFVGIVRCDEIDPGNRSIRIGCDILPELRRQGYGTRTYRLLLKYCFDHLNMHRVWLLVLDFNTAGVRLYTKIGFQEEGRLRHAVFRAGTYRNYVVMSILENEYRQFATGAAPPPAPPGMRPD
ncbi:MAG: GNAT family N-acetyltransferase [Limisphaerales bacterium]